MYNVDSKALGSNEYCELTRGKDKDRENFL